MLTPIHLCALIGINAIFAGAYLVGKVGVGYFPPLFFSMLRFALVFVALLPFLRMPKDLMGYRKVFFGFCFAMGIGVYSPLYVALSLADGVSAILIGTQFSVPIAALLSIWLLGDKISRFVWLGIVMAFSGVLMVGFDSALLGYKVAFTGILVSAFFYGLANVLSRQLSGKISVLNLNAWMSLFSVPPMLLLSLVFEENQWAILIAAQWHDWATLLYSSLVVSLVGHVGLFALLRQYSVAVIMPWYVLMPIFGVIGSAVFFGEQPTVNFYVGALIALFGVWIVNNRSKLT